MLERKYEQLLIKIIGRKLRKSYKLGRTYNKENILSFFSQLDEDNSLKAIYLKFYIYEKFTGKHARKRKVSAREFEDFIACLFNLKVADALNLEIDCPNSLKELDEEAVKLFKDRLPREYLEGEWSICKDLIKNKKKKTDVLLSKYRNQEGKIEISIKTLLGRINDGKENTEINIGSLSYRALFLGLVDNLSDRKGGLGSGAQLAKLTFSLARDKKKLKVFTDRLVKFLEFLYSDNIFLVAFKSDLKLQLFCFNGEELIGIINKKLECIEKDIESISSEKIEEVNKKLETLERLTLPKIWLLFEENYKNEENVYNLGKHIIDLFSILYRWENNNLRIQISSLLPKNIWEIDNAKKCENVAFSDNNEECKIEKNPFSCENLVIVNLADAIDNCKIKTLNKDIFKNILRKIIKEE